MDVSNTSRDEGRQQQQQVSHRDARSVFYTNSNSTNTNKGKWRPSLSILIVLSLMEGGSFRFDPCGHNQSNYGIPHWSSVWSDY